jgi:hypothetical protein
MTTNSPGPLEPSSAAAPRRSAAIATVDLQPLAHEKLFRAFLRSLFLQKWVVYAKPPFGGPPTASVPCESALRQVEGLLLIAGRGSVLNLLSRACVSPPHQTSIQNP